MSAPPKLEEIIEGAIETKLEEVYTSVLASVVSFDEDTCTIKAQPLQNTSYIDDAGEKHYVQLPVVHNVPVLYPGGGDTHLLYQLRKGDQVLLLISSGSLDELKAQSNVKNTDPSSPRRFNLQDSFALPRYMKKRPSNLRPKADEMIVGAPKVILGSSGSTEPVARKSDLDSIIGFTTNETLQAAYVAWIAATVTGIGAAAAKTAYQNAVTAYYNANPANGSENVKAT